MESENNLITLNRLLSSYQDLFLENWILIRERMTSIKGFQIRLDNLKEDTLYNALESNFQIEAVAHCKYFYFFNKGMNGYRSRDFKGVLFNDVNEYEIIINNRKYIKKDNVRWDKFLKKIHVPAKALFTIKETKTDLENLTLFSEYNFLESSEQLYQHINNSIRNDLKNQTVNHIRQFFKKLNFPEKVNKDNKQSLVDNFNLCQYSKDLGLLSMIEIYAFELMESKTTIQRPLELWEKKKQDLIDYNQLLLSSLL